MADRPAKPEGMSWVTPYLFVKDTKGAIEFYEKAFGFTTSFTMPDDDGDITHAEMKHNDAVIMLGKYAEGAPGTLGGTSATMYLYVDNIDDFHRRVKEAGGEIVKEPADQFWGDRTFNVRCPEGHHWMFAQNVSDFDPSKAPK
jgi:PhnB protein